MRKLQKFEGNQKKKRKNKPAKDGTVFGWSLDFGDILYRSCVPKLESGKMLKVINDFLFSLFLRNFFEN